MTTTAKDIMAYGTDELGMTSKAAYVLSRQVEAARRATQDAMDPLTDLRMFVESNDPDAILGALRRLAGLAGYSNSIGTAWAELVTAAGAVSALLEGATA